LTTASSDVEEILTVIDRFGVCRAAQDVAGTLAMLSDDPDVTVMPSDESADAHRGPGRRRIVPCARCVLTPLGILQRRGLAEMCDVPTVAVPSR
jgi:hypothetical protein